tara:strand:+ start:3962 stop:5014 length:1053 start_codon:yes stop_codon:yes gene_type:complete
MTVLIPDIRIEGVSVPFFKGAYTSTGGLTASTLQFTLPLSYAGFKNLWNKEVTFYLNEFESTPIFRGYIKRVKQDFNKIEVIAQDVFGYMVMGGNESMAKIALTEYDNLDGLTTGPAIKKAIEMAKLNTKIGTDFIGDTTPSVSSSRPPIRGTLSVLDIIKQLMGRAVDNSGTLPRPNMIKIVDDGSISQLIIELESELNGNTVAHNYTEHSNIIDVKLINRKVPTVIIVNGLNGVASTFSHESAIEGYDRNYLEVTNDNLKSPAECKDFAQKLFRANLQNQYEYTISSYEGAHLSENNIIRVDTDDPKFTGYYRVRGKKIAFSTNSFTIGININKKPPTLAEYVKMSDN